jgi:hypothetical protein
VKTFRVWLLLLLAVLLPVRGALAVGMQCSGAAPQVVAQASLSGHGHGHHSSGSPAGHHDMSAHGHPDGAADDPASASDKCNLCAASCSVTGMVSGSLALAEPQRMPAVFPQLHAPPPSFVSDGQERPPRTT